jgi:hypothetical protein
MGCSDRALTASRKMLSIILPGRDNIARLAALPPSKITYFR